MARFSFFCLLSVYLSISFSAVKLAGDCVLGGAMCRPPGAQASREEGRSPLRLLPWLRAATGFNIQGHN